MTQLTVQIDTEEYWITEPDSDDLWDYGVRGSSYDGCRVYLGPSDGRGRISSYTETVDVPFDVQPGQQVYPVIVRYSTGSTFGREDGRVVLVGVWETSAQAQEAERLVRAASGFDYATVAGQKFYTGTWVGYFEYLEDVMTEVELVRP